MPPHRLTLYALRARRAHPTGVVESRSRCRFVRRRQRFAPAPAAWHQVLSASDNTGLRCARDSPATRAKTRHHSPGAALGAVPICICAAHPRRHLCTRLALSPCACATAATDAPGSAHAASTRAFNSSACRRLGALVPVCMVSTFEISEHLHRSFGVNQDGMAGRQLSIAPQGSSVS